MRICVQVATPLVTKNELSFYGIESDMLCLLCQEPNSISHAFLNCHWSEQFFSEVIKWSNKESGTSSPLELMFGLETENYPQGTNKSLIKFNFTLSSTQKMLWYAVNKLVHPSFFYNVLFCFVLSIIRILRNK